VVEIVGREEELGVFERFFGRPSGGLAALVLEGEAGIGKSTLWLAGVEHARKRGLRVLLSRPAEAERGLAHGGLSDLLEGVLDRVAPQLTPPRRRALEAALLIEEPDDGLDPRTLAVAVRDSLDFLSSEGPIVLGVDDVQWLDPSSAGALAFALRRLQERPVLLVLARRVGVGGEPAEVEQALEAERVERLRVGPLSLGAVQRLLRARLDRTYGRLLLVRIHEASGGNPFYALELARALDPSVDPAEPLPVAETLDALVGARLAGLPVPTRDALALVAALGTASNELLEAAGVEPEALAPAFGANVVEHHDKVVRFTHPLLASALWQRLRAAERRRAHSVVAQLVTDPISRARHLALAAAGPDAEVAAVLEASAAGARARGVPVVAAELAELAHRLTSPADREARHRRAIIAAHAQLRASDVRGARARALDLLATAPEGPARAEALVLLSAVESVAGDPVRAIELRREALLEALEHPALQASIHQWLASAVRAIEGIRSGEQHARVALELAERLGDDALRAGALAVLALLRFNAGEPDAPGFAEEAHQLALDVARRRNRPATVAHDLAWSGAGLDRICSLCLVHVLVWSARLDDARALLGPLYGALREHDELGSTEALWYLGLLELQAGHLELAADCLARRGEIGRQYAVDREGVVVRAEGGQLHLAGAFDLAWSARISAHRGELELAGELARRGREATDPNIAELAALDGALGTVDLWKGDASVAVTRLVAAEQAARAVGFGEPNMYWWRAELAEALLEVGRVGDAAELLDAWEADASRVGRTWVLAQVTRCRGLVAAHRGDIDGARALLERAVAEHEEVGDPFGRARALLALGVIRRRARLKRHARDAIEAALAGFEEIGASGWAGRAQAELGRIGGRTRTEGLTPAERRVADLVAEGRTNREVAAALFLGERTVASHLTHIYTKLGVRSRTELARRLR
jgi:DNA-binding CsgD family transcriptional regulator